MFDNIGSKLKSFAKVLFGIMMVGTIAYAIYMAVSVGKLSSYTCRGDGAGFFAGFGIFLLIMTLGTITAWISCAGMYALGQYVEDTEINRQTNQESKKLLSDIKQLLQNGASTAAPKEIEAAPKDHGVKYPEPTKEPPKVDPNLIVVPIIHGEDRIRCPQCDAVQPADRRVCWNCGVKFKGETLTNFDIISCPHCGQRQSAERKTCLRCGKPLKEAPAPKPAPVPTEWNCPNCGTKNETEANFCYLCGMRKPN